MWGRRKERGVGEKEGEGSGGGGRRGSRGGNIQILKAGVFPTPCLEPYSLEDRIWFV